MAIRPTSPLRRKPTNILFVTKTGRQIPAENLCYIVRKYARAANVQKHINPHAVRHACATHLLQNGCNLRYVQELLGHRKIDTTGIYTHLKTGDVRESVASTHPRSQTLARPPA